ncbi:MAG: TonB-dependent receptor [Gammaproteobacteria bacterium]|nr:TonB-dependent receptor [Gammaproteobacteria bacterium]MDH5591626.1 TonB-dependent receptor [Gammaproteobacteria bacterium]
MPRIKSLALFLIIVSGLPAYSYAEHSHDSVALAKVTISGQTLDALLNQTGLLNQDEIDALQSSVTDTAQLLDGLPGVSLYGAGGVSSLPALHGLADDRLRIKVDGMDLVSACANHMNPPLSYINPANVDNIQLYAGLSPVSMGGDSIGGTILVESTPPAFAQSPDEVLTKGELGAYYRSNGDVRGGNISTSLATDHLSINYNGSTAKANNYSAGDDFKPAGSAASDRGYLDGDEVGSSSYESNNHSIGVALHQDNHLLQLKLGYQNIPYQGWPNQRMDMVENKSNQVNLMYKVTFDWGLLETALYSEKTHHKMQFGEDKQYLYGTASGMPMETEGDNVGFSLKTEITLSEHDLVRLGTDIQQYKLDDYWEASGTGSMSPNTFWNINNGERDRYGLFAEWESAWTTKLSTLAGIRYETVKMDAGDVQGYSSMFSMADRVAFNNSGHEKTDDNFDITLLSNYRPSASQTYEIGYAQKTRSPNLYERYSWATHSMAMRMVNLAGDGNGYVGNINLEPEIAHTISATANWHDAAQQNWNVTLTPYLSYVNDYIDTSRCKVNGVMMGGCSAGNQTLTDGFVYLRYQNQSARLYGIDASAYKTFIDSTDIGTLITKANVNYVRGKNRDTGDNLYNIMPLNAKFSIEHNLNRWKNTVEWEVVSAKDDVNAERNEVGTSGYGLLHLRTSYEWKQARFDLGIENVFDRFYSAPLAGAYLGQGMTMSGTGVEWGTTVPGVGRSIYAGTTFKF